MKAQNFIVQLQKEVETHEAVHHPFLKRFSKEHLSFNQLHRFGLQHYQLVRIFVNYMTNLLPRIPDPDAGSLLRSVFDDEFGQHTIFRSHPALYRKFLKSLGLEEEAFGRTQLLPEVSSFIDMHMDMTRDEDFRIALGAIGPGHEFSIPIMFSYLVSGFRNAKILDDDMEYFTMHIIEDKEHAVVFNTLILRHVETPEGQEKVREGVMRSLEARRVFWNGLERTVFEKVMC
jgi:pyrroloquinoline-quinone synthase